MNNTCDHWQPFLHYAVCFTLHGVGLPLGSRRDRSKLLLSQRLDAGYVLSAISMDLVKWPTSQVWEKRLG